MVELIQQSAFLMNVAIHNVTMYLIILMFSTRS